ncbi:transposable element Tcb2 transposase [Trichonephila clavipes]|uniref:Transposable element Tcb2 transposase n=1 Tax=Trichonephila clavipes TaxID=2585209 RepID=A0A8X7BD83_TRICX|nr:transposable element Tcb2 transposase [Trichonephila clavipes]
MPLRRFRRRYRQLSQFDRRRIIGMMEAGLSARRVAGQLGRTDCVVKRFGDQWIRGMSFTQRPGSRRPRQTSRREDFQIVLFSDESRFNLSSDDNRFRVWRPCNERLNPAFALQRHTAPTAGVMVWGAIAYNTRSPLELIRGTMTAQRYVHDILQPHVWPLIQRLPGSIFQQDIAQPHTARVSQDCLRAVTTLPRSSRSPYFSPIEHIWDHLGRGRWQRSHQREMGISERTLDAEVEDPRLRKRGREQRPSRDPPPVVHKRDA